MSFTRRYALISLFLWAAALAGIVVVLAAYGPERFSAPGNSTARLLLGTIMMIAYFGYMLLAFRHKRARQVGEVDERDVQVARRASEATLIVAAMLVFFVLIVLWEIYNDTGSAPAGWFYALAYGLITLVSTVHAAATLIFDARGSLDG